MRPTKTANPLPKSTVPVSLQKKHGSGHRVPTPENLNEPSNVLDLQRTIGNQATIQLMQDRGMIQRMPTDEELMAVAGKPLSNRFFGLKKMSTKYKAVLDALKTYHKRGNFAIDSYSILEYQDELLEDVRKACQTYVDSHKDEKERTPHIQRILVEDVKADKAKLDFLRTNFKSISGQIMGKTIFQAMNLVERMKNPTDMQSLMQFLQYDTTKQLIQDQTKSAGTQPFRGSDDLTLAGTSFTNIMGESYIKDTLGPHIGSVVSQLVGKELASQDTLKTPDNKLSPEDLLKKQETLNLMKKLYEDLVVGLLLDTKGGTLVPQEILDAAAEIYATVYSTVSNDPKAEHSAEHAARVSVVNMIFLRFINPAVIRIAAKLGEGSGQKTLIRLAQIFQSQVNGIDVVKKFPELSEANDVVLRVQGAIDLIINGVVSQGQLLGQQRKK
ncbi:MAG: RasGAP domain-containing protein [Anaerolineae bacterium]